ncbi:hypothetical protein ES707_10781 [subsurface metagenome]
MMKTAASNILRIWIVSSSNRTDLGRGIVKSQASNRGRLNGPVMASVHTGSDHLSIAEGVCLMTLVALADLCSPMTAPFHPRHAEML